jgi:hypothetical protein
MRTILNSNTIADGVGNSVGYVQNEHNQITRLDLYDCGLKELPPEIGKLQNLMELNLEVKWDSFFWKNGIHVEIQINNMKSNICLVK